MTTPSYSRVQIRPEAEGPIHTNNNLQLNLQGRIILCHPHYCAPTNVLLHLLAPDGADGGLDYGFAHIACGILAGNRWDGFFTAADGSRLQLMSGDIMPVGMYYFNINGSSTENPYPVVPSFKDWQFPHNAFPPWKDCLPPPVPDAGRTYAPSSFAFAVACKNETCRLSGFIEGCEAAHLCPESESDWFNLNNLSRYNIKPSLPPSRVLSDTANAVLLRQDIHMLFDANMFVFLPKVGTDAARNSSIVTHLLVPSKELGILYHNAKIKPILNVHPAFLLARFAWAILRLSSFFRAPGLRRKILTVDGVAEIQGSNNDDVDSAKDDVQRSNSCCSSDGSRLQGSERGQRKYKKRRRHHRQSSEGSAAESVGYPLATGHTAAESVTEPQTPRLARKLAEATRETDRVSNMIQEWLKHERERSDPGNLRAKEEAWAEQVWDGKIMMMSEDVKRFNRYNDMGSPSPGSASG